ncbi:unnamed protein product [Eretmochelys imbricata]
MEQSELRHRPWASPADREVLSEAELEEMAPRTQAPRPSLCSRVWDVRCSCGAAKSLLFRFLPVLSWLPRYPVRDWVLGDIASGFSVGIMHLPQGLAYALLAGVPPVTGLYTSLYPVVLYFLFGTSRHISVGPFAVISIMIGSVTGSLMPNSNFMDPVNGTNETVLNEARRDSARVELVATLTVLVGIFQIALGMLQFGFVVTYLSEPLVRGYTTAAAVHVLVSQLKYVFGVEVAEQSGPFSMFAAFIEICTKLPQTNVGALVTNLIAMVTILPVKMLSAKFASKLPMPIPIEFIMIVVSTGISYGAGLKAKFGIAVVGNIPSGMKPPVAPNVSYFGQVVGNAFAIAVVGYAISISMGKIFALKHGYKVNSNQELFALGICNFVGGFFQCFSISCSMSRTLVQEATGGNSQVAGVIASLLILVTILKIGQLFQDLPKAILAAIVIVNLKGMFNQFTDLRMLWRSNRIDLLIWLVTFVATLLLNLDMGLGVSVAFALLTVIFRTQLPRYSILGQVSNTDIYRDMVEYNKTEEIPGVKIFRSSATVYFANAELYAEALKEKSGINVDYLIGKKKKALKKQKKQQEKDKKEEAKKKKVLCQMLPSGVPSSLSLSPSLQPYPHPPLSVHISLGLLLPLSLVSLPLPRSPFLPAPTSPSLSLIPLSRHNWLSLLFRIKDGPTLEMAHLSLLENPRVGLGPWGMFLSLTSICTLIGAIRHGREILGNHLTLELCPRLGRRLLVLIIKEPVIH